MIIWFNRALRWGLGGFFIVMGIRSEHDWYTIAFGMVILLTGFLKPCRCIMSDSCEVPPRK